MARILKYCMQSILKSVNLIMAMAGIAMIFYGFWMVRVWQRDMGGSSFDDFNSTSPWFIYTFLGTGTILCLLTCLGHIAADTANGFCLSFYMMIISVLILLETGIAADVLLNSDWERDLPQDPTGRFHDFKEFVKSNIDIFKWIGLLIFLGQGLSILLAMVLRACVTTQRSNYDSDEEFTQARLPLINNHPQQPAYAIGDPAFPNKNEAWNVSNSFATSFFHLFTIQLSNYTRFPTLVGELLFLSSLVLKLSFRPNLSKKLPFNKNVARGVFLSEDGMIF